MSGPHSQPFMAKKVDKYSSTWEGSPKSREELDRKLQEQWWGWSIGWQMGGTSRVCHGDMHLKSDSLVAQGSAEVGSGRGTKGT